MNKIKSLFLITSILSTISFNALAQEPTTTLDYTNDQYYLINNHENIYDFYKIVSFDNVQVVDKSSVPLSKEEINKYSKYQDKWVEPEKNIDFTDKRDNFFKFATEKVEKAKYEDVIINTDIDNYRLRIQYQYDKNLMESAYDIDITKYYKYKFKNIEGKTVDQYGNVYGVNAVQNIVAQAMEQYKTLGNVNQNYILSSLTNKIKYDPVLDGKLTNVSIQFN